MKCDELKSYTIYEGDVGNYTEHVVYSKSEADTYIRKLKYKRCLAMARWCESEAYIHENGSEYDEDLVAWFGNWYKRWLELAEKFKEAK